MKRLDRSMMSCETTLPSLEELEEAAIAELLLAEALASEDDAAL